MKSWTEIRCAVRIMIDLAQHEGERVRLKDTATRQQISAKYCEKIVPKLQVAGLAKSIRGARGGYLLGRPAKEITIGEIVRCVDAPYRASEDVQDQPFEAAFGQALVAKWRVLDAVTLGEVAGRQREA